MKLAIHSLLIPLVLLVAAATAVQGRLVIVGETVHRSTLSPGSQINGTISILNDGLQPVEVRIYQTDYRFAATGENAYPEPGSLPKSNAKWLTLDANQLSIPTNTTLTVNYRGSVPAGASSGTFWSLIMVEQTEALLPPSKGGAPNERRAAIRTVVRHAVQVVTDLGAPAAPDLKVIGRRLEGEAGNRVFLLDVENQGAWLARPEVSMEAFDASGTSVAKLASAKVRLYPSCSFRHRFDLSNLKPGKYTALVILDNGDENVNGAQYEFEIPH